jgi:hypothetical protein
LSALLKQWAAAPATGSLLFPIRAIRAIRGQTGIREGGWRLKRSRGLGRRRLSPGNGRFGGRRGLLYSKLDTLFAFGLTLAVFESRMNVERLAKAKALGFSDRQIAHLTGRTEDEVRALRHQHGLVPSYRLVDTCAASSRLTPLIIIPLMTVVTTKCGPQPAKSDDSGRRSQSHRPGD